ncbi:MAG: hypothetical protein MJB57_11330 [Gemmatimonadetes bacterium]|nr:hypothetical protein [Gemmatimonadota bacterium]
MKNLIHEIHRRSLWQVIGIYLGASWVVLQVVDTMAGALGLPDWASSLALFLLVVGFPIVLATAFVQEGLSTKSLETPPQSLADVGEVAPAPAPAPSGSQKLFTWRNAIGGGVVALAAWGLVALGWVFLGGAGPAAVAPVTAQAHPSRALIPQGEERDKSIAVLPFTNMSPDPENAFFADGVHESLLTQLSKIRDFRVLSRASMLRYRDTDKSMAEIADEVGAGAILQGSVQRAGGRIRISTQLIDPRTEKNLWASQYDGRVDEIFDFQSDVALSVASQLETTLNPNEVAAVRRPATESVTALDFYLEGRQAYDRFREEDNEEAIRLFREAIAQDSGFALAWAGLGDGYLQRVQFYGYGFEWVDSAEVAGRRAIEIDSTLADGYKTIGFAVSMEGRNGESAEWYERAFELNPNQAAAANNLGVANILTGGDWAEALRWWKRSFRIDPSGTFTRGNVISGYSALGELEIAQRWVDEAMALEPDSPQLRRHALMHDVRRGNAAAGLETYLGFLEDSGRDNARVAVVAAIGAHYARDDELRSEWSARALEGTSGGTVADVHDARVLRAFALSRDGLSSEAFELLADAEREYTEQLEDGADNSVNVWWLSAIHLIRGSRDEALDWLERATELGFNWWRLLEADPIFDDLRDEPRYQAAVARVKERVEAARAAIETEERAAGERP